MCKNIVIAGAGIAGLTAAKAARDADSDCQILLLGSEKENPYTRTRLPEYISGEIGRDALFPYDDSWFENNRIRLMKNCTIESIDTQSKQLLYKEGSIPYHSLIITTGSSGNIPNTPGVEFDNVMAIRTLEDADKVKSLCTAGKKCTVVGGGLLGLETAWAIRQTGCEVTVVEYSPRLLPRQIDEQCSSLLFQAIEQKGIKVLLNKKINQFKGSKQAEHVLFEDGSSLETDFVILSIGVCPSTEAFAGSGLEIPRWISVNEYMETNLPGIYAAGDVAAYHERNYSLWPIAIAQGKIAGHNAVQKDNAARQTYTEIQPFTNLKIKGISLFSIGNIAATDLAVINHKDESQGKYAKLFVQGNQIKAAILFGEPNLTLKVKRAVENSKTFDFNLETVAVEDVFKVL